MVCGDAAKNVFNLLTHTRMSEETLGQAKRKSIDNNKNSSYVQAAF